MSAQAMKTTKKRYSAKVQQKAERIFQRALSEYNDGHPYNALQTARYALRVARRSGEYCKAYICGFLAQLKAELGQYEMAKMYCRKAISNLEKFHIAYKDDKKYYEMLMASLSSMARS